MSLFDNKLIKNFKGRELKNPKFKKIIKKSGRAFFSSFFLGDVLFKYMLKYKCIFLIILLYKLFLVYMLPTKSEDIYDNIEKFLRFNFVGNLSHSTSKFYHRKNPKISIVISTFNGEVYLKPVVRSIQNQNFLDIEIIIVNDGSLDKSVEVVKRLMKEDSRIKLLSNVVNRGTLYTKTKGVLNAKGRYVMTLDHDNLYATKDVFNKLYRDAENYHLDLLGFSGLVTTIQVKGKSKKKLVDYFETRIIKKPYIKKRFLSFDNNINSGTFLCLYFIKTKLFLDSIKQLRKEFIERNIDAHDDTILMFIISRKALRLKHFKEIYYIILKWPEKYNESLKFQRKIKNRERLSKSCYSYLTFIEVLILFTENSDKYIAEKCLDYWFFKKPNCRHNKHISKDVLRVLNFFLNDEYISFDVKKKINSYLSRKTFVL